MVFFLFVYFVFNWQVYLLMMDGLYISVVGMAVVFVVLAILMFLIMGMGRVFEGEEVAVGDVVVKEVALEKVEAREALKPEDTAEVAAIALALASYLKEKGREFRGPIAINGVQYQVEVGDLSRSPVFVGVNQDSYWAALGDEGLPSTEVISPQIVVRERDTQRGLSWRSAQPLAQGGYWSRQGWTGRRGIR